MDLVELRFFIGGKFDSNKTNYVGGATKTVGNVDPDRLSYWELIHMCSEHFGRDDIARMFYTMPGKEIDCGLRLIYGNDSVRGLIDLLTVKRRVDIYLEHREPDEPMSAMDARPITIVAADTEHDSDHDIDGSDDSDHVLGELGVGSSDDEEAPLIMKYKQFLLRARKRRITSKEKHVESMGAEPSSNMHGSSNVHGADDECHHDSEHLDSSNYSFVTSSSDDEPDHVLRRKQRFPKFNPSSDNLRFELGMTFGSLNEFKEALTSYAIKNMREIKIVKNDKKRVRARCKSAGCSWVILASYDSRTERFQVKTYDNEHTCNAVFKNAKVTARWLAPKLRRRIESNPRWKARDMKETIREEFNCDVDINKCNRVKRLVMELAGRPRKNRCRAINETRRAKRVSGVGRKMTCRVCKKVGHNKAGCPEQSKVADDGMPSSRIADHGSEVS